MEKRDLAERLIDSLENGGSTHALIIEGPRAATEPAARLYAKALLCTGDGRKPCGRCASCRNLLRGVEEDLILVEGTASGKSGNRALRDERIAAMQDALKKKPLASDRIVALILDADLLTERAQNRLLKTLEEPPGRDCLILLSENTRHLLPTILSRCRVVKAAAGTGEETESARIREFAKTYFRLAADGRPYYEYLPLLRTVSEDKPTADAFLDAFEETVMKALETRVGRLEENPLTPEAAATYENMIYAAEEARKDLARNVNVGYALKDMTLRLI